MPELYDLTQFMQQQFAPEEGSFSLYAILVGGALLCMVIAYLLGSISPAALVYKLFYRKKMTAPEKPVSPADLWRLSCKGGAVAAGFLELFFAALAYFAGFFIFYFNVGGAIAGFFAVFGRMYPVFNKFRGGKGLLPFAAVVLCASPLTFAVLLVCWLVVTVGTRFASLATVMCALLYPLILRAFSGNAGVALAIATTVFIVIRHLENLRRIYEGKEPKLQFSKKKKESENDPS